MKQTFIKTLLVINIIGVLVLTGCGAKKSKEEQLADQIAELQEMASNIQISSPFDDAPEGMQIVHELCSYLETLQKPANNIEHYCTYGWDADLEIEADMFNKAYAEKDTYVELANKLTDEYSADKKAFDEAMKCYAEFSEQLKDLDSIEKAHESGQSVLPEKTIYYYNSVCEFNNSYLKQLQGN
ncbi:hypothetical protein [Butyrivibrio sp. WCD3002]|uniref:hypothetical protein n=1 Tax=Butyrivibrio sp. WCD3002 TaxID=1280676 RepID=UPI00047ABCE5|nr:hypothetical protein [Butyrivibrio sp. WCD3002]